MVKFEERIKQIVKPYSEILL